MRLSLKRHFDKPLKMLYRYKSKWFMPPKIKTKYGLSKAKLFQKDLKRITRKIKNKLLKEQSTKKKRTKMAKFSIQTTAIPSLVIAPQNSFFRKKYIKIKVLKTRINLKKKKYTIKKYLKKILKDHLDINSKANKITAIVKCSNLLNKFAKKTRLLAKLRNIKKLLNKKNEIKYNLKKRLINNYTMTSKYFSNYSTLQNNIVATVAFLKKKRNMKKSHLLLNYIKNKQGLTIFRLKEKESYVYNQDILDSNFLENNLREIWGVTPAKSLSDFFLSKVKRPIKSSLYQTVARKKKKNYIFRSKKKAKYKKNHDKMYYKKRRINFEERSYNRLNLNELKKKKLKVKRRQFTLLNLNQKRPGIFSDLKNLKGNLIKTTRIMLKKGSKKLLFLNSTNLIKKLYQISLLKSKYQLRPIIKSTFRRFIRLLKRVLKKNRKKIRKYTRKILFFKKQKGLFYRKKKIEILNFREHIIRENHRLREEIKLYRYIWKNSPFFNYNKVKQSKLNQIISLRKQRSKFLKVIKKYPEGMSAIKERLNNHQYYTGLSLLKRRLE